MSIATLYRSGKQTLCEIVIDQPYQRLEIEPLRKNGFSSQIVYTSAGLIQENIVNLSKRTSRLLMSVDDDTVKVNMYYYQDGVLSNSENINCVIFDSPELKPAHVDTSRMSTAEAKQMISGLSKLTSKSWLFSVSVSDAIYVSIVNRGVNSVFVFGKSSITLQSSDFMFVINHGVNSVVIPMSRVASGECAIYEVVSSDIYNNENTYLKRLASNIVAVEKSESDNISMEGITVFS